MKNIDLKTLNKVLENVVNAKHSDFYRNLYAQKKTLFKKEPLKKPEDWQSVPLLTKQDIIDVSFWNRVFATKEEIDVIRNTSGTTGKNVLLTPRNRYVLTFYPKKYQGNMNILTSLHPLHMNESNFKDLCGKKKIFGIDPKNLDVTAKISQLAQIDTIVTMPFILDSFIPYLDKSGVCEHIEFIEIFGERCTKEQKNTYKKIFPNAKIYFNYGLTELQGAGGTVCEDVASKNINAFHFSNDLYVELIDPKTEKIITGKNKEGEIVLTTLWVEKNPLPLIRYRTGDSGHYIEHVCSESGETKILEVLGKTELEKIKVAGGEIKIEEAERVVGLLKDRVEQDFQLHFYKIKDGDKTKPKSVFHVTPRRNGVKKNELEKKISKEFRLSPEFTYENGVSKDMYLPLECVFEKIEQKFRKKIKLINHS